jgi:hypothetical protein
MYVNTQMCLDKVEVPCCRPETKDIKLAQATQKLEAIEKENPWRKNPNKLEQLT